MLTLPEVEVQMIDWDRVTELRNEIGAEDFTEVIALFLEEADGVIATLPTAGDAKSLENVLHFLKGSALNLGFLDLSRLCQDGERRAAQGQGDIDLAEVRHCYEASKLAFCCGLDRFNATRAA